MSTTGGAGRPPTTFKSSKGAYTMDYEKEELEECKDNLFLSVLAVFGLPLAVIAVLIGELYDVGSILFP
jgi:hypothetical protein